MSEKISDIVAERDRLRERERRCPTMAEAEARSMLRALQEIAAVIGLGEDASPAMILAAVRDMAALNGDRKKQPAVSTKPILGQEAICRDGLGRVIAFCDEFPHQWIQVSTYVNDRQCKWDPGNVTLIPSA
ncbi:hypothetical protein HW932_18540 [Allochromatium humboldtianum]|uniref:Uncharacterized protein n=1 Tax=Allochromatium humboldtianum TaxID=504901 RepID=A0A850RJH0_9GAMM|nr:hypothetical protein [Allochromatium humboldtianum]NVZ11252.1 hypothetical protein [Allochromatium humboldtianum]